MVCDNGIHASGGTMEAADGVPASASQAKWSSVGCQLPHCPYCGAFVSPTTGVCNNRTRCPKYGNKVTETMEWPPKGVRFTTDKSKFGKPVTVQVPSGGDTEQAQATTAEAESAQPDAAQAQDAQPTPVPTMTSEEPPLVDGPPPDSDGGESVAQPAGKAVAAGEAVAAAQPAQPQPSPQMAAFQQMQAKAREEPVVLKPLGEEENEIAAKQREVDEARDAVIDGYGANVFDAHGNVKEQYRDLPLAQAYEQARAELEALQNAHKVAIGVDLAVDQPAGPNAVDNADYWGAYEYGDSSKNGTLQDLPCARDVYEVGHRWAVSSGVGATEGRDTNKATVAGAHTPVAADLLAHNSRGHTLEQGDLVLWHGSEFNQASSPAKCPQCGKFVSPGRPCTHCGHNGAFAAVYDRATGESACFVEGCPGNVHGEPCPHQVGAMAYAVANDPEGDGAIKDQLAQALDEHRRRGDEPTAVTAGDAAYVLLKEEGPDTMTFGSADVAERAREAFESEVQVWGAEAAKQSVGDQIRHALGNPNPPVPSQSGLPPAEHNPNFVMTEQVEDTMEMMGGALRLGFSPNARGMMGRAFGFFGPPGTGKNAMLRETAATLGLPYREIDLGRGADLQAMIGEVVLEPDGKGGTRSVAKLGPVGKALTRGEVVALNEIIHTDPDSQTVLHQIAQDGQFTLHNPEGADQVYQVHPSSILGVTWNPKGGLQDRPSEALYSRFFSRRVGYPRPAEEQRRLMGWAEGQGLPDMDENAAERTISLVNDLRNLSTRGGLEVPPTFRDAQRFVTQWKLTGNVEQGLEQMRGLASQLDDHDLQWQEVTNLFERHFGDLVA
jgi:MoxR-like ATPase